MYSELVDFEYEIYVSKDGEKLQIIKKINAFFQNMPKQSIYTTFVRLCLSVMSGCMFWQFRKFDIHTVSSNKHTVGTFVWAHTHTQHNVYNYLMDKFVRLKGN